MMVVFRDSVLRTHHIKRHGGGFNLELEGAWLAMHRSLIRQSFFVTTPFSPNCAALDGASVVPGDVIVSVCRSVAVADSRKREEEKLKRTLHHRHRVVTRKK